MSPTRLSYLAHSNDNYIYKHCNGPLCTYIHPSVNDKYVYDKNPYNCFEVIKTGNKIISLFRKHSFYTAQHRQHKQEKQKQGTVDNITPHHNTTVYCTDMQSVSIITTPDYSQNKGQFNGTLLTLIQLGHLVASTVLLSSPACISHVNIKNCLLSKKLQNNANPIASAGKV